MTSADKSKEAKGLIAHKLTYQNGLVVRACYAADDIDLL